MSKEITIQDIHSVIEKEITEWIELGEDNPPRVQEQIKVRVDTLRMLQGKFKSQLTQSYRELELKVLRGEWEPGILERYYVINKEHEIWLEPEMCVAKEQKAKGCFFAPTKELARTLSSVITGSYRPTQRDIDERIEFWVHCGHDSDLHYPFPIHSIGEYLQYFFTEQQRAAFALRVQGEKEEPEDLGQFYAVEGEIFFGRKAHADAGTNTVKYAKNAANELNNIRTELARLTKLHPKD